VASDGDVQTVVFPRPADLAFGPAAMLMRAAEDAPPAAAPLESTAQTTTTAPAATAAPAPPPAPRGSSGGGGSDIEEIYDQVMQRLRRDLLADRERMGDMLGDLP
jgi:hypothetical protein